MSAARRVIATLAAVLASIALEAAAQDGEDERPPDPPIERVEPLDPATTVFPGGYTMRELTTSERIEVGGGEPLTFGQVLASVQRHHPSLESARQDVVAAQGAQLAAEGGFDLTLNASGWAAPQGYYDWGRADVYLDQPTPLWGASIRAGWRIGRGGDVPDYYGNYETLDLGELRAEVRVPLWRDGPIDARRARIWQAEHATRAEQSNFEARMLRMRVAAARAYWSWVAAGRRYQIASALLDLAEQRDAQIAAQVRAGAIPPIESLENRRVILSRRTSLVSARRSLEQAAIALSLYFRRDDGRPHVVRPRRLPAELDAPTAPSVRLREEVRAAWTRRPELDRYRSLIERQEVSVDYAENRFAPRIDVAVGASVDLGSGTMSQQETLGPAVVEGSVYFSMPLQFREARGGIAQSRAELAALRADAQLAQEQIATEVQDAHSAVTASHERVELAREAAEIATAVANAERRRFELGATELFIVNLREQSAAAAQATLVDAEAALQIAHARWRAVTAAP